MGNKDFSKKEIRKLIIRKRDNLDKKIKEKYDEDIKNILCENKIFLSCKNIFIYVGFGSEINTSNYIEEFLKMDKNILIPRTEIESKKMDAVQIQNLCDLEKDKYGILEPKKSINAFNKSEINLVILPGVVFSESGDRIGYGGGYYDRYLKTLKSSVPKIALCYEFQIQNNIISEPHDIKADYIITEKRIIKCK